MSPLHSEFAAAINHSVCRNERDFSPDEPSREDDALTDDELRRHVEALEYEALRLGQVIREIGK